MFAIFFGIIFPVVVLVSAIVYGYHPKARFLCKLEEIIIISILIIVVALCSM